MTISLEAKFDREKINQEKDYVGDLMVTMRAPEDLNRTPIAVALVLDVSGSMSGLCKDHRTKIEAVKDTAAKLIRNLTEKDKVAIIIYDSYTKVIQDLVNGGNKEPIIKKIDNLMSGSATNMSGGILQGISQLNVEFQGVKRVLLLSDGLPNEGIRDKKELVALVTSARETCTVSTFGFGNDADQGLLADLAKAGGGNYYFVESSQDSDMTFARELGGITSCKAQNIEVEIDPHGNEILEVLNDFTVIQQDKKAVIKADDIYAGEVKNLVIRMKVPKRENPPKDRLYSLAHVTITYDDLEEKKKVSTKLIPKIDFVPEAEADKETRLEVAEQVILLEGAKAQREAVKVANTGDYQGAQTILRSLNVEMKKVSDRGSTLANMCGIDIENKISCLTAENYTSSVANEITSDGIGFAKGRGTGRMSSAVYHTAGVDLMQKNFQTSSNETLNPQVSNTLNSPNPQTSSPTNPETPTPDNEKKGFSKTRTSSR